MKRTIYAIRSLIFCLALISLVAVGISTASAKEERIFDDAHLFTETNKVTDDVEMLWLYNTTAIVSERLAMFSVNRAWAKTKEKAL